MHTSKALLATVVVALAAGAGPALKPRAASAAIAPADAQSQRIVAVANAFLATLTDAQKKQAMFAFTDQTQRQRWSNFPVGMVPRAGVAGAK